MTFFIQYRSNLTVTGVYCSSVYYTVYVLLCQCYSRLGTILSDVNCRSRWVRLQYTRAGTDDVVRHATASTLAECQKACEFDFRCVSVDWKPDNRECDLSTNPDHTHHGTDVSDHYELVGRCNTTEGECFDSNVVPNTKTENYFNTK